jgi:D-sedoheptulose 7-phosphate isomerase
MHDDLDQFRDHYADRAAEGMAEFVGRYGLDFFSELQSALKRNRSVIYFFGNGGSHAIGYCLKYALQAYASERGLPARIQTGVDVHQLTSGSYADDPGISFTQVLRAEGADVGDLVILISGSGDSDNLYTTARYTFQCGIPTFALLGSSGGKIREVVSSERCFTSPLEDQQISEDIIQSLAYCFDLANERGSATAWSEIVSARAEQLRATIKNIPIALLDYITELIVEAFDRGHMIWVLGMDHPALSACAEHTAHNLYWDGIYQLAKPPRRLIFSSPTACNFSGISNDRRRGVFPNLTGIQDSPGEGLALVFAMNSDSSECSDLLDQLDRARIRTCLFSGQTSQPETREGFTTHQTGLDKPQMQAGVSQIFGHMLGRLVRLNLLERERSQTSDPIQNPAQFLIDFDLAQRRLLDD